MGGTDKVRIGIDVGGTFTDVVVIDNHTHELIGQLKIPTTHAAPEGVALGIVTALEQALSRFDLTPQSVSFIAHSTTQATNALLEGDVARIGIVGLGTGIEGWLARKATAVPPIPLTAAKRLSPTHRFVRVRDGASREAIAKVVQEFAKLGLQVVVASEAFGVDRNQHESLVSDTARQFGLLATTGHEVSGLYGLRVRTRTAVINAAILPRMIETAMMTERCVHSSGIRAPLMIMRSDGGVMSVGEVHRRPILTMLSGPAAGIAGALMHERISDGIFLEVGGTSTDISVIRDGCPSMRPARLSGHRMYLSTLDVRTLGIAGGSMVRMERHAGRCTRVEAVGPRSAHIAGLGYCCFANPEELRNCTLEFIKPTAEDSDAHVVVRTSDGKRYAITTTCAANLLGCVQPTHFAYGNRESAHIAFELLARSFSKEGTSGENIAAQVLQTGCQSILRTIEELIAEYRLDRSQVVLVGGGGGAAALVPYAAKIMALDHRIARNAEVISPLGVAMAMVRDTVERNIVEPTPDDILRVRREATEAAMQAGAVAESIEVQVEVDKRRNLVRAIAMGTTEIRRREGEHKTLEIEECRLAAARSMHIHPLAAEIAGEAGNFLVFTAEQMQRAFAGLFRSRRRMLRVVDRTGVVRLQRGRAVVVRCKLAHLKVELTRAVELLTDYGDAGRAIPDVFILYRTRIANFSGLAELDQVIALAEVETRSLDPATNVVIIACPKAP
jgi:N-methylhydantoinase A